MSKDNQSYIVAGSTNVPLVHDYEGAISAYLKERYRDEEWPYAAGVQDDYAPVENHSTGIVQGPPKHRTLPPVGINEYLHPSGASRFGRGLFLIDHRYMPALLQHCWDITWDGTGLIPAGDRTATEASLSLRNSGSTTTFGVYLQQPIQLDAMVAQADTPRQLWLCPFVDRRYLMLHQVITADVSLVRSDTTWAQLISRIQGDGNTSANPVVNGSISAAFQQPDPGYFSVNRSAAYAVDHLAHSIGTRVTYDSGVLSLQDVGAANSLLASVPGDLQMMLGEQNGNPRAALPKWYQIETRQLHDHYDNGTWKTNEDYAGNDSGDRPKPHVLSTFYLENYGGSVDSGSQSDSDALTQAIADNYDLWQREQFTVTYAGNPRADGYWKSAYSDYMIVKLDCSAAIPQLMTTEVSRPPGILPLINISQRTDLYRHNEELARITLNSTGIPLGQQSGTGEILTANKSDTVYDGTPHEITVNSIYAVTTAIPGGHTLSCYYQSEDGWYLVQGEPGPPGGGAPWIRFRVLEPYGYTASGVWTVKITQVRNADGTTVAVDDEILVHDPNNLFADVVFSVNQTTTDCGADTWIGGSTGTAYLRTPATSANIPPEVTRWEVETCSRSIDDVRVRISSCLLSSEVSKTGFIESATDQWNKSAYPAVDFPPEIANYSGPTLPTPPCWEIVFTNTLELNAVKDSYIRLRRVTSKSPSLPLNSISPHNQGVTTSKWYAYAVEEDTETHQGRFARFVNLTKGGPLPGGWTLVTYWDGQDPFQDALCRPTIECLFDCSCLEDGDKAYASYDPIANTYRVIGTESALLGPPQDADVVVGVSATTCGYNFLNQPSKIFTCGEEPVVETIPINTVTQTVHTGAYRTSQDLCFTQSEIEVCATTPIDDECWSLCAPCDCADYLCAWKWNAETAYWEAVSECPEDLPDCNCTGDAPTLTPAPGEPTYVSYPCGVSTVCVPCDECSGGCEHGLNFALGAIKGTDAGGNTVRAEISTAVWTLIPGGDCCVELSVDFWSDLDPAILVNRTATVCIDSASSIPACQGPPFSYVLTLSWDGGGVVLGIDLPTEIGNASPGVCAGTYGTGGCGYLPVDSSPGLGWDEISITVSCCVVGGVSSVESAKGVHYIGADFHRAELGAAPPRETKDSPSGWGDKFVELHSELFKGCNCKKDIVPVMNRWGTQPEKPTGGQIANVARTLYSKQKRGIQEQLTIDNLAAMIINFITTQSVENDNG